MFFLNKLKQRLGRFMNEIRQLLLANVLLTGRLLSQQLATKKNIQNLAEVEFKVFSQFGDDGIIQYFLQQLDITDKRFVEFGVENYLEANTRFLLMNNNWSGLVMDGSVKNVASIKDDEIVWRYDLQAVAAFISKENINALLKDNGFAGEIGLLSIDIDGNDYWVWEAITVTSPILVIVEYNSIFGNERTVTVPYRPDFNRTKAHFSNLYWGTSLPALCALAEIKGYNFIGSNSAGNNAYFVRKDKIGNLKPLSAKEGYVVSKFRDSRNEQGDLSFLSGSERLEKIKGMPIFNVISKETESL